MWTSSYLALDGSRNMLIPLWPWPVLGAVKDNVSVCVFVSKATVEVR